MKPSISSLHMPRVTGSSSAIAAGVKAGSSIVRWGRCFGGSVVTGGIGAEIGGFSRIEMRREMLCVVGDCADVVVAHGKIDTPIAIRVSHGTAGSQIIPDGVRVTAPVRVVVIEVSRPIGDRRALSLWLSPSRTCDRDPVGRARSRSTRPDHIGAALSSEASIDARRQTIGLVIHPAATWLFSQAPTAMGGFQSLVAHRNARPCRQVNLSTWRDIGVGPGTRSPQAAQSESGPSCRPPMESGARVKNSCSCRRR